MLLPEAAPVAAVALREEESKQACLGGSRGVSFEGEGFDECGAGPPGASPPAAAARSTKARKSKASQRPSLHLFGEKKRQQSTSSLISVKNAEEDDDLWDCAAIEDSSQVEFPEDRRAFPIFDPFNPYRVTWDAMMMIAILFVMIVTPFEMAFIADPGTFVRLPAAPSSKWLWCMNRLIDFGFLVDLLLAFNTAYFDEASGTWVTDRGVIARNYLQAWLWPGQHMGDSTSLRRGCSRSDAREASMARFEFAPRDARSSKNEPKRVENDRDTRF